MTGSHNIAAAFATMAERHPERLAIEAGKDAVSYGALASEAARLAGLFAGVRKTGRIGILGSRSVPAYAGIMGAAWSGGTYVPLNMKWPEERLAAVIARLELDAIVADDNGAALLTAAVLDAAPQTIVLAASAIEPMTSRHRFFRLGGLPQESVAAPVPVPAGHVAYIMFTSGTTGMPKGVEVSAGAVAAYLEETADWTAYGPSDRIGESCDITFDLSVHTLLHTLGGGASLHPMSQLDLMAPARFVRAREITVWFSVPTIATMMRKAGALKADVFPSLRLSIFCGEPLPLGAATDWALAAPNSIVENIYGPTEATIACSRQMLTTPPVVTASRGIVAIGKPFSNTGMAILDADLKPVPDGTPGQIALSGVQLAEGYFKAPEITDKAFRMIGGERWYLTGDLGLKDRDGVFHHLGRIDNQIKLKGNRIELEEVDMHLRKAAGTDMATVVAWPVIDGSAQDLVGFIAAAPDTDTQGIRERMATFVPRFMVPSEIRCVAEMPVNSNGKIDRKALAASLEAMPLKGAA